MKRKIQVFIILLLAVIFLSGCDGSGFLPSIPITGDGNASLLTPEEIELIKTWGYGGDYVIRWPDGYVDVYDATGYSQMQKVLNQWNSAIGGKVVFRLSENPNSPVQIIFDYSINLEGNCSSGTYEIDENYSFIERVIKINPIGQGCLENAYQLYLSNFSKVVGCNVWTELSSVPFEDWSEFYEIPEIIKKMVRALHKVPPGYYLLGSEQPVPDTPNPVIENVDGVKWEPIYQGSDYRSFLLVDYYGDELKPPRKDDKDYVYPDSLDRGNPFYFVITGKNFGNKEGSISIEGKVFNIKIINWKDNRIIICPSFNDVSLTYKKGAKLTLITNQGKKAEYSLDIIASIGRQPFGQCTWWVCRRLLEIYGKNIYDLNYGSTYNLDTKINNSYIPEQFDVLIWWEGETRHQALIEEFIDKEKGIVLISQYNQGYNESFGTYETGRGKIYKFSDGSKPAGYFYRIKNEL